MRLNKAQWCWLLYDPGNAAFALLVRAVFAPLFFMACAQNVWSESVATANWAMLCSLAGIAAGVFSLYFGALADAAMRRKLALLISTVIGAGASLTLACVSDYRAVMIIYFIALASYMVSNSFYDSLLCSVAPAEQYGRLSTWAYGFGYLGGLIPFLLVLSGGMLLEDQNLVARSAFVLAGAWWILFSLPLMLVVRENPPAGSAKRWYDGFAQLYLSLKTAFGNRNSRIFLIAYFLYIDGVSTILLMAAPISVEIGMSQMMLMGAILGLQVIGFPTTVLCGKLAERFSARKVVYAALTLYVIVAILLGIISQCGSYPVKLTLFLLAAFLIALVQGGIQALSRALFGMLVPEGKAAEFFGVYNIFGKFTTILGPVLVYCAGMLWGRSEYGIVMLIGPFILGGWLLSKVKFPEQKQ